MNTLITRNRPNSFNVLNDIDHFMNNLLGTTSSRSLNGTGDSTGSYLPPIDVAETDKAYTVRVELPGVDKDALDVSIDDGVLTISAERKDSHDEDKDGRVIRRERRYGKFSRSLKLAEDVLETDVKARYDEGVLALELPKSEQKKPHKVDVVVNKSPY